MSQPLKITDVVLRDGNQSLIATRMRLEDMLPIAEKLDQVGYWSLEVWGGATFDACIRYLGEDPWDRMREFKKAMPNTPQQMLLRGQNLLGYRHYADDVVTKFVERAAEAGVDVFRIFDAMNDVRNLKTAIQATLDVGKHAQGTISYTVSPVHSVDLFVDMGKRLQEMGCHSIAIKDMAGLLKPYVAEELVTKLKQSCDIPIAMQCHATTGLSTAAILKAAEAGIDMVDTSISSMSMTYGHSSTEAVVAIFDETERSTGLDLSLLEEISAYFREVRKKYIRFEGSLKGTDSRILLAQVPGGMLTNMENQLREQGAIDKFDEVLEEIPRVRKDLGYIPLVTPTSQIVGTQAVLNVVTGERYKSISKETLGVLKGEYGATPAPVNESLRKQALQGESAIECRPADLLEDELPQLMKEFDTLAKEQKIRIAQHKIDDVLTFALFPQVGMKFLENRDNPAFFEPTPSAQENDQNGTGKLPQTASEETAERYTVTVNGQPFDVVVAPEGVVADVVPKGVSPATIGTGTTSVIRSPMAGSITKVVVKVGQAVAEGELVIILEAMKMETEVRSSFSGTVKDVFVAAGDSVAVDSDLIAVG
ncbi:MAG TPA: oxaloacetate decarboxylase subunit alpha [Gammaproteobacteria bacterium]|nr:oxaloacetate decarboxylase subunit alpha [Gammaproteobacteria bacterium]